ncbi:MAG TPA: energy transducer TonB [Rhodanobacteraceae bacterium]|nr:energy transducer TonB [Rhodanobacteraceae bacterium]
MSSNAQSADRLGVTLLFSVILHAVLVLGIGFNFPKPRPVLPALDVTLVQTANAETPEHADFLAQANNRGGGNSDKAARPSQRFASQQPKPDPGVLRKPIDPSAPRASDASGPTVVTTRAAARSTPSQDEQRQQAPSKLKPSPIEIRRKQEMARLAAEVSQEQRAYAKRPKTKFLSANTREYAYAAYMSAWVARVQRIGNLNYPDEARQRGLHGQLILTVVLRRDGSIKHVEVIQSSGHKLLDAAAMRIVRQAGPFPAIPQSAGDYDEFNITRTWQFLPGDTLTTSG